MEENAFEVVDEANRRGHLRRPLDPREPRTAVVLEDDAEVLVPTDRLSARPGGGLRLSARFEAVALPPGDRVREVIPVVEERLIVGKREVETGRVRVRKTVTERDEMVDEPLLADEITIERVPINRFVDEAEPARLEGDTTVIPLFEEQLILQKRLVLREEVRVTRRRVERRAPRHVTVRREEATIERVDEEEK